MVYTGNAYTYPDFITWIQSLSAEGKTSGANQSEALIAFTQLNLKRMDRIYKTLMPDEALLQTIRNLKVRQQWTIITEAWCGDSAQSLPIIARIAESAAGRIGLNVILRDENMDWMHRYQTNGSNAIPKLIAKDEAGRELFTWGPRPIAAQKMLTNWKANPEGLSWDAFETRLHTWYAKDKGISIQSELHLKLSLLDVTDSENHASKN